MAYYSSCSPPLVHHLSSTISCPPYHFHPLLSTISCPPPLVHHLLSTPSCLSLLVYLFLSPYCPPNPVPPLVDHLLPTPSYLPSTVRPFLPPPPCPPLQTTTSCLLPPVHHFLFPISLAIPSLYSSISSFPLATSCLPTVPTKLAS